MPALSARFIRFVVTVTSIAIFDGKVAAASPPIRTDTVFLASDLDGNGKTDYVVRESKPGRIPELRTFRIAVYLDAKPRSKPPAYTTTWADAFETEMSLDSTFRIQPGISLLELGGQSADYDFAELLLVESGRVVKEIKFGVDYGNGYMDIQQRAGATVIEATQTHLELRGKPVERKIACRETEWEAVRLVFDAKQRRFKIARPFCMTRKTED